MYQILCGDTVIDTDDVQLAIKIEGEDAQRRVFLRGGRTAILRGEEEVAFDEWAATLPRAGAIRPLHIEQLTAMAYKQGRRAGRQEISAFFARLATPSCQTCKVFDDDEERCTWTIGHVAFPECHEPREETPKEPRQYGGGLCDGCDMLDVRSDGLSCTRNSGQLPYPECHSTYSAAKDPRPLCKTCACYEAESGHCTEFAGNHYPECWVATKGKEPPCGLCKRSPDGGETCARAFDEEFPACFVKRKEAELRERL